MSESSSTQASKSRQPQQRQTAVSTLKFGSAKKTGGMVCRGMLLSWGMNMGEGKSGAACDFGVDLALETLCVLFERLDMLDEPA